MRTHRDHSGLPQSLIIGLVAAAMAWVPMASTSARAAGGESVHALCGSVAPGYARCLSLQVVNAPGARQLITGSTPSGYGPMDLRSAYNLPSTVAGSGLTVAVTDAYDDPTAETDLGTYRAEFGIPPCTTANGCFRKVDQTGGSTYPVSDASWSGEISLDLDMVSAICPLCHIVLVEANNNSMTDLGIAVNEAAALGAAAISNSWGGPDWTGEDQYDEYFDHPGIAITAASGDWGYGASYPAVVPSVIAVGGTSLVRTGNGRGWSEVVWNNTSGASGGGCSAYEAQPAWQAANTNITGTGCTGRASSDVSAVADPYTGVAVYDSTDRQAGWGIFGGTSVASPIIASVFALAGNTSVTTPAYLYSHTTALNDVTSGNNYESWITYSPPVCVILLCEAGIGWDGPTGLGTPNGITAFGGGPAVISSLTPAEGPVTGGQVITVAGTGFELGMTATLGATPITLAGVSATSFTFVAPAEPAGTDHVAVTTSEGVSALTPTDEYTYGDLPVISSIAPLEGPVGGGQTVTVTGSAFEDGMTATSNGTAVTPTAVSATSFTFTTPPEPAGVVQIQVTTWAGASELTPADDYTYGDLPAISSVSPAEGPVGGGQTVTVTGTRFEAGMTTTLGGVEMTPSGVTSTSFTFITPAEPAGLEQLQVTTWDGTSVLTSADDYSYGNAPTIGSVTPEVGLVAGGQSVTVTGSGFAAGMTVTIGGVAVTPTSVTPTSFTLIAPAESAGLVDIQVTTLDGTSALTAADEYTYGILPVISALTPSGGLVGGGQAVTVTGGGFTAGMTATVGGTTVTPLGASATSFTFTAPAEVAGVVQVQVTTAFGASAFNAADEYTYETLPVISAVTPSAGPVTGGQVVTVTGSGFVAGMSATIGGIGVTPSSITASSFTFTTPAETAGYDQIQVTDLAGASALTSASGYIYSGLGSFVPVTPFRILDTRSGFCGIHTCPAAGAGQTLSLQLTGYTDARTGELVPTDATAVVLNVLAVNGSSSSLLTVYPSGTGRPLASDLNFPAHVNIANLVTVALGQNGASDSQREVNIYNALGTVNVVVDVEGYFVPQASNNPAGEFHPIVPLRVCDTRTREPANGCNLGHSTDNTIGPAQVLKVNVSGIPSGVSGLPASIPADGSAGAAVLNLTAVAGTQATWLSVFPTQSNGTCPTSVPGSSTINVSAGAVLANRVMVPLGPGHSGGPSTDVCVYNAAGTINVLLDASGWFGSTTGSPATGAQYQAIGPTRICDTRSGTGTPCSGHQLTSGGTLLVAVAGVGGIPGSGPVAIIANLTAVSGSHPTYLTVYPADVSPKPNASDLNVQPGIALPNLVVVGLATGAHPGDVNLFNAMGSINAVLDVDGWFQ